MCVCVGACVNFFGDYVIIFWYLQLCFCIGVGVQLPTGFGFDFGVIFF